MPAASSSRPRKRHNRAPSSDIEEDDPSQMSKHPQQEEDVEMDEEEQQPRRAKKSKKEKKRTQQDDSEGEVVEEEEEDIPVPEIEDQPLDKAHANKLHGLGSDWSAMRQKSEGMGFPAIREVAASIAEFTEGEKGEKALNQIDMLMRAMLDVEQEILAREEALNEIHQQLSRGDRIAGIVDIYDKATQNQLDEYKNKTSRQKYAKNEHYSKFKQAIYEVNHPDSAMPPLVDMIPREDGDVSDDEDDLQMGGITQDYKCPLTLTHLVEPLTSKLCKHSYSAAAIREYLGQQRGLRKPCPATGCHQLIGLADLEVDNALAKRAKEAARRERAREEDSDDEEIIE